MSSTLFPKSARLLFSRQFQEVDRLGEKRVGKYIVVFILRERHTAKLGITASRRFGDAVMRNVFKRRLREAFRLSRHEFPLIWIHVKPRAGAESASTAQLQSELRYLIVNKG